MDKYRFKQLLESTMGNVKPLIMEQQTNFSVIGHRYENPEGNPDEKNLVVLKIKDFGSGETFVDVQVYNADLKTAYDQAVKKFNSDKESKEIIHPGIKTQVVTPLDKLVLKN